MGDDESNPNSPSSCRSSPISLPGKTTDSINISRESSPQLSDSVKEEENAGSRNKTNISPCSNNKPSAQLSFSIARLINKLPANETSSDHRPSGSSDAVNIQPQHPPVYPIPMWAPTTTASANGNNNATIRPSAFPSQLMPGYFQQQQPFPDPGNNSLNQMLRNVLMHQPTDALATLMRHYQQQFYASGQLHFPSHSVGPLPPPLNLSSNNSVNTSTAANLQKVEILRSAASASLHHSNSRPSPLLAPHHLHGKSIQKVNTIFLILGLEIDVFHFVTMYRFLVPSWSSPATTWPVFFISPIEISFR
jgi:hypothetical protein